MSKKNGTEPTPEEKKLLAAWRTFFQKNCKADFAALATSEEDVWGFELQWSLLETHKGLGQSFLNDMEKCLHSGQIVIEEQFRNHNIKPRPIIRIVGISELHRYHLTDLRMRDRTRFLRFDAVVHSTSRAMGWLKRSAYTCNECTHEWVIKEALARARTKAEACPMCLRRGLDLLLEGAKREDLPDPRDIRMDLERNYYEDIQYVELFDPTCLRDEELPDDVPTITAVVSDEYVNQFSPGQCITVNALIGVDHLPSRDYIRDTRRILRLDIHSVEEGFSLHEE
jgi:DNA replicative helicase MCM subunit Mcm2 (Cdc46/Mcm family)